LASRRDSLERVRAHDQASYAPYLRGLAYLSQRPRNAITSFQDATRQKGIAYTINSPYALSYLGLGRGYAMSGDKANAKKAPQAMSHDQSNWLIVVGCR
jgi:hypothetical protein